MAKAAPGITLKEISTRTGISVVSLIKYKKEHTAPGGLLARFVVGSGRRMKFHPAAVAAFLKLRKDGVAQRGRKKVTRRRVAKPAVETTVQPEQTPAQQYRVM